MPVSYADVSCTSVGYSMWAIVRKRVCKINRLSLVAVLTFFVVLILLHVDKPTNDYPDINSESKLIERKSALLVVLVLSSPENRVRRDAIRKTWMTFTTSKVISFFSVGAGHAVNITDLRKEASANKDLIILNEVSDEYNLLTHKLLASFHWLTRNVDFAYVLKVDDDTFARIDIIANELEHRSSNTPLYWGFFQGHARVYKTGRWAENNWVLCDHYLPYARGGGYVLSSSLVTFVVNNSQLLQRFNSEDISVGTWLAPLSIDRQHDPRFDTEHVSRGCNNEYIVTHKQSVEQLYEKYKGLIESGQLCGTSGPFRRRLSYIYDWSVLPSLCCIRNNSSVP